MLGPEACACAATCPRAVTEINAALSASRAVAEAIRVTSGVSPSVNSIPPRRDFRPTAVAFLSRSLRPSVAATKATVVPMAPRRMAWDHRRIGKLRTPDSTYVLEGASLVQGLLAGDDAAIRALYGRFGRPVYTMGLRLLGSRMAAEELTQDVFLTAWRKAARFDPQRGRLSTWLMTIAHNLAVDRLRRDTGVSRPHLVLVDEVPDRPAGDEESALIERDEALRALASLSDAEKRLIARAYFRGMTAREIAEADAIPLGTVKTRLRSALIKIRKANELKEPS